MVVYYEGLRERRGAYREFRMHDLKNDIKNLPKSPGVYLMHDDKQEIIYIGKAKNLKNRVSQYFQAGGGRSPKIAKMITLISYFEYIVTDSEVEALILENNLIKEYRPRYNTMLRDDKTYPYIRFTLSEDFPRLIYTRKIKRDKDKYYGPFPDATAVQEIIELLNRSYKLRTCSGAKMSESTAKQRACLNYHIERCDAPCTGNITKEEYAERVREVRRFLEGTGTELIKKLKADMKAASDALEFEKAGEYKALLESALKISSHQKMEFSISENRDVLGFAREDFEAIMQVFFVREGKLTGREHFYMKLAPDESDEEIITSFIKQYYSGTPFLPAEILLPGRPVVMNSYSEASAICSEEQIDQDRMPDGLSDIEHDTVHANDIYAQEHSAAAAIGGSTCAESSEINRSVKHSNTGAGNDDIGTETDEEGAPVEIADDIKAIEEWLTNKAGRKVSLIIPQKGKKEKFVELAAKNAALILDQNKEKVKRQEMRTKGAVTEISKMIGINYAKRIESYDISNISGVNSVGSMVVFEDGKAKKNDYRKFRIKTVKGPNDVASMKEVLGRRLKHTEVLPDLILIDGGKGQVNAVLEVLDDENMDIPVCGMVKDDHHRTRGLLYNNREFDMDRSKESFKLLTRIQDETHRFAIEYHRSLRSKGQTKSILDEIEGIGPKRRRALLKYFKSMDAIKQADVEEILKVPEMNRTSAEKVVEFFTDRKF